MGNRRTADEHPSHWPERRCIYCNTRLLRRYYPDRGAGEDLNKFIIRKTCNDPVCIHKLRSDTRKKHPTRPIPERPPFECPVCGKMATRPPNVKSHVWWRRKTCGDYACISAMLSRSKK